MSRVYNFSAGPAVLPEEVLKEAQEEMLDYRGCGMSVMEMSHRSKVFQNIIDEAEADLRDLMGIPSNYKVLFLQGGASLQFSMIPMNLMKNGVADYIVTGQWAKKAYAEAQKYGKANKIASSEDKTFSYIPDCSDLPISPDADYVYICENNTIYGTKYKKLPNTKGKTLVADVSSCFLSEPVNVSDYGIIYGGVQKNIGPAGMVISIIRDDLITDDVLPGTPTMMKFKTELLLHLHVRQSLQMAEENGRPGSYETAQRRKSKTSVRFPGSEQALQRNRRTGRPFSDERSVYHRKCRSGCEIRQRVQRSRT